MEILRILFALDDGEEAARFARISAERALPYSVSRATSIADLDAKVASNEADFLVTDFHFQGGSVGDWLSLWPLPAIILLDESDDDRLDSLVPDETCEYLLRSPDLGHLKLLPALVRKVLNARESVDRQNAHVQMSERRYLELMQALPDIVYVLDGKGRFSYVNDAVASLGWEPWELIGKHFSEIIMAEDVPKVSRELVLRDFLGKATGPVRAPKLFDERRTGVRMTRNLELRLKRNPRSASGALLVAVDSYGEVSTCGISLPEFGEGDIGTVGVIRDVSARKEQEGRLRESVKAKEVLLKEIHHRVKNNLQVISSLLSLQKEGVTDAASRAVFTDCETQIHSMSMVHEQLYRSEALSGVRVSSYLAELLNYLSSTFDVDPSRVAVELDCDASELGLETTIPLALVASELVTNALKHAFPAGRAGAVKVRFRHTSYAGYRLEVSDDGAGFDSSLPGKDGRSIGMELVEALASQLKGKVCWESSPGSGSRAVLDFQEVPG